MLEKLAPIASACLLLSPATLPAQAPPGSIEIGGGGGRFFTGSFAAASARITDRKADADDDVVRGFWLAAQLSREWGVEIAVRRRRGDSVGDQPNASRGDGPSSLARRGEERENRDAKEGPSERRRDIPYAPPRGSSGR